MFVYSNNCIFNMSRLGFIFGYKLFSLFIMYKILYNRYMYVMYIIYRTRCINTKVLINNLHTVEVCLMVSNQNTLFSNNVKFPLICIYHAGAYASVCASVF